MIRAAINGFGRMGRAFFRLSLDDPDIEVVALNDRVGIRELAYLLRYDSIHGTLPYQPEIMGDDLVVRNRRVKVFNHDSLKTLPWKRLEIDVVIEATGAMRTLSLAREHLSAKAKKVVVTANPQKQLLGTMPIFLYGVNEKEYRGEKVIAAASCSANCAAPVLSVLHRSLSVQYAHLTSVHAYTMNQRILDSAHPRDLRRGRAAALNIVPSVSDAALVVSERISGLKGRIMGSTIRVPVADGSLMEIVCSVEKSADPKTVNDLLKNAAATDYKGIIEYSSEPLVSRDTVNNTHSAIVDSLMTSVAAPSFIKVAAWYDHEWGYAARLLDMAKYIMR